MTNERMDDVDVIYRGTAPGLGDVQLCMSMPAGRATAQDAWSALRARFGEVDPYSLEIEVRERPRGASKPRRAIAAEDDRRAASLSR